MTEVALPELRRPPMLCAVVIETVEIVGKHFHTVTTWAGAGRPPRRKWFADGSIAVAHAAELADEFGCALVDITSEGE